MCLIGRNKELDRIRSIVRGSKETALTISGRRGTGKSALLAGIPTLSGYRTVFLAASAAESDWPLSGLTALLNGMDDPVLNEIAADVLHDAAGALTIPTVSTVLLSGLHQRSSARTVIVIDDADQLDAASQAVIGFISRRLTGTDIALFMSVRDDVPEGPLGGPAVLHLGPLSYSDTVRMLEAIPSRHSTTAAAHAVAAASQGNPLAAVELYRRLLDRQVEGKYALPVPLPCSGSFEAEAASSVAPLTPGARQVLDLLALSRHTDVTALECAVPEMWADVDELLAAGLVTRSGRHLGIPDQLLRGYVFSAMTPAVRTAGHHALAQASGAADPHACRWHMSFTAIERQTPFGLLRSAVDLIGEGEVPFAVECLERALTINPWEAETAARLTTVAELMFNRGEFVYARRYLEWAQRVTRNPALVLRLTGLSFEIEFIQGGFVRSSMVLRLVKEFGSHNPGYAANLLALAALYFAERWELGDAAELLDHVTGFQGSATAECLAIIERARMLVASISGDTGALSRKHEPAGSARMLSLLVQGRALSYAERYDHAQEAFALVRSSSDAGSINWHETAVFLAVDNEIRAGNVRAAVTLIDDLERHEPENKYHRGMRHIFRVWRAHALSDEAGAQAAASEALRYAGCESHPAITAQLAAWQGHFALLRGDLAESFAQLSRAAEIGKAFSNPALLRSEADLVEVLIRLGRHREATQALLRLESRSMGLRSPWLVMAVARNRAMLADGEQSLQLFSQALEGRGVHDSLLERARTLLCYAERLNAFGRVRPARDALAHAKVMFEEKGAAAWSQHVDAFLFHELLEPARRQDHPAMLMLSDHERALAKMVARGMRNKDIAATLYVSVRTVEVRLTSIYRKLGVESRAQLTALAAARDDGAAAPYVLPVL